MRLWWGFRVKGGVAVLGMRLWGKGWNCRVMGWVYWVRGGVAEFRVGLQG